MAHTLKKIKKHTFSDPFKPTLYVLIHYTPNGFAMRVLFTIEI